MLENLVRRAEQLAGMFLLAVALLTFVMVILRKFFDAAIPDWYDLSRLLQGMAILWGMACACWRGSHIQVDLIWDLSSTVNRRRIDVFAGVVLLLFMAAFAALALEASWGQRGNNLLTSDLHLPQWGFYLTGALGVLAAVLASAAALRRVLRDDGRHVFHDDGPGGIA